MCLLNNNNIIRTGVNYAPTIILFKFVGGGQCVEGFTENLSINYTRSSPYKSVQSDTILFPSLRFKCTGYLHQATILYDWRFCYITKYYNVKNVTVSYYNTLVHSMVLSTLSRSAISIWSLSDSSTYVQTHWYPLSSLKVRYVRPIQSTNVTTIPFKLAFSHVRINKGSILGLTIPRLGITGIRTSCGYQRQYFEHSLQMILVNDPASVVLRSQQCIKPKDKSDSFPCFSEIGHRRPLIKVDFDPVTSGGLPKTIIN